MTVTFILFQRGATGWSFQIGRLYWQINFWTYWKLGLFGHIGWDKND